MISFDSEPDNRAGLLITGDRYRKQLAISAAVTLIFAVCMIAGQGHMSMTAGVALGSSALLTGGSIYHHQMRKIDLNGQRDRDAFRWKPSVLELIFGKKQTAILHTYEKL